MKNINIQLVILSILLLIIFSLGVIFISTRNQMMRIEKIIEHINEDIDETKTGVARLLNRKSSIKSIIENISELPQVRLSNLEYDFGKIIKEEGEVSTDFIISNIGEGELLIGDIVTSCSCTSAKVDNLKIVFGESAILKVKFDPNFHEEPQGRFSRSVFVVTNDPNNEELEFKIFVEIIN